MSADLALDEVGLRDDARDPGAGWGGDGDLPGWVRVMRDQILAGPPGLLLCGLAAVMLWV